MTVPFINAKDLADYLHFTNQDLLEEGLADIAIDSACQSVRDWCDQLVEATAVVDKVNGNDTAVLVLPHFPIISTTSLKMYGDGQLVASSEEILVDGTDYVMDAASGIVERVDDGVWTRGTRNIVWTGTYGHDPVPTTVRLVALQIAARIYDEGMAVSESAGTYSGTFSGDAGQLSDREKRALHRYRKSS